MRTLLLSLLMALHFAASAATVDVAQFVGTWRVIRGDVKMQILIEEDGRIEFASLIDGSSMNATAVVNGSNGQTAFGGVLANGQGFAIGLVGGVPTLSLGQATLTMQPVTAQTAGDTTPQPSAPSNSALAGLHLSTAKGRNGYFTERSYDFCPDGRVFTRWAESQMSQFGSGVSERKDQGTWRQNGGTVELNLARGGAVTLAVQQTEARVIRLDATGYAVERSGKCR